MPDAGCPLAPQTRRFLGTRLRCWIHGPRGDWTQKILKKECGKTAFADEPRLIVNALRLLTHRFLRRAAQRCDLAVRKTLEDEVGDLALGLRQAPRAELALNRVAKTIDMRINGGPPLPL
jgi:hypothetical protein